ncbi:MAG: galactokinase family protein [Longimicrobiales bacterium]|nr:galactokinase family protein [Longimicrobiales bacterium]
MPRSFAPGRVNLIGEHIDYHGLPVLPMALSHGVRLTFVARTDAVVVVRNADPGYGERRFPLAPLPAPTPPPLPAPTPGPSGDWGNYVWAAAVTVASRFGARVGIEGTVSSDLPAGGGLSSSSALVVAVAQALLYASNLRPDRLELAEALAEGERLVGTAGGGMDQAASLLGREGYALRVSFDPLTVETVRVLDGWAVVVADSGVRARKSAELRDAYNRRRTESARALAGIAGACGLPGASPARLVARVGVPELLERCAHRPGQGARWAEHALAEAGRVEAAVAALRAGRLQSFGQLLDASHASLRDVYRVSHPRLDALVAAARGAGAAGARLTGAGFGGCMLAVCAVERAAAVAEALAEARAALGAPRGRAPFRARPGGGAHVEA